MRLFLFVSNCAGCALLTGCDPAPVYAPKSAEERGARKVQVAGCLTMHQFKLSEYNVRIIPNPDTP